MESTATSDPRPFDIPEERSSSRDELKALRGLRTRIEGVVAELDRLRTENATLAQRLAGLEEKGQNALPFLPSLPAGEDMRERLDAFIAAIDHALREADSPGAGS
jgi:hypothetical protein